MKNNTTKPHYQFVCPKDGVLDQTEVDVWCNHCKRDELVQKGDIWLCPSCEYAKEGNFSCRICQSRNVKLVEMKDGQTPIKSL